MCPVNVDVFCHCVVFLPINKYMMTLGKHHLPIVYIVETVQLTHVLDRLVIKTFEKSSRPRPWPPGLETKTKTLATRSRDRDQDLGNKVSRSKSYYRA